MDIELERLQKQIAESNRKREAALIENRAIMLKKLKNAGITKVGGEYEGYGDSGNSSITELAPDGNLLSDEDKRDLEALIWDFAYNQNPGFEINEGGEGSLEWDIPSDCVDIDHMVILEEHESYENV